MKQLWVSFRVSSLPEGTREPPHPAWMIPLQILSWRDRVSVLA